MYDTMWNAEQRLLSTTLTGMTSTEDVAAWRLTLDRALEKVPDDGVFKLLVDIRGYEPANPEAHKAFRVVIPMLLADYGFRPGFLDLYPEAELAIRRLRGVTCIAHANVHHDAGKMATYEQRLGRANERFFTDIRKAEAWIAAV